MVKIVRQGNRKCLAWFLEQSSREARIGQDQSGDYVNLMSLPVKENESLAVSPKRAE